MSMLHSAALVLAEDFLLSLSHSHSHIVLHLLSSLHYMSSILLLKWTYCSPHQTRSYTGLVGSVWFGTGQEGFLKYMVIWFPLAMLCLLLPQFFGNLPKNRNIQIMCFTEQNWLLNKTSLIYKNCMVNLWWYCFCRNSIFVGFHFDMNNTFGKDFQSLTILLLVV